MVRDEGGTLCALSMGNMGEKVSFPKKQPILNESDWILSFNFLRDTNGPYVVSMETVLHVVQPHGMFSKQGLLIMHIPL